MDIFFQRVCRSLIILPQSQQKLYLQHAAVINFHFLFFSSSYEIHFLEMNINILLGKVTKNVIHNCSERKHILLWWAGNIFVNLRLMHHKERFAGIRIDKVHIFWEGHKILRNLRQLLDWQYIGQIISRDFF